MLVCHNDNVPICSALQDPEYLIFRQQSSQPSAAAFDLNTYKLLLKKSKSNEEKHIIICIYKLISMGLLEVCKIWVSFTSQIHRLGLVLLSTTRPLEPARRVTLTGKRPRDVMKGCTRAQGPSNTSNLSRFEQELSWCDQGCSPLKVLRIICIVFHSLAFPRLACILLYVRQSTSITLHAFSIHYVDIASTMLHISFCSRGPSPSPFEGNCLHPGCRSLQTVQRISCHSDSQNRIVTA